MTLEAAAGKNAAMHVGKSYSIVAHRIARALMERCPDVADATCVLVSRIGSPVETPQLVEMQLRTRDNLPLDSLRAPAESIATIIFTGLQRKPRTPSTVPMVLVRAESTT